MTRSAKLGISSLILVTGSIVSPIWEKELPFSFVCGVISCVLGWLASREGSRWWLLIPASVITVTILIAAPTFNIK